MAQIIKTEFGPLVHLSELVRDCGLELNTGNLRRNLRLAAGLEYVRPTADDYERWRETQDISGKGTPIWLTQRGAERVAIELVQKHDANSTVLGTHIQSMADMAKAKKDPEPVERPTTVPAPISDVATQVAVSNVINAKIRVASAEKSLSFALATLESAKAELETIMDAMAQEQM